MRKLALYIFLTTAALMLPWTTAVAQAAPDVPAQASPEGTAEVPDAPAEPASAEEPETPPAAAYGKTTTMQGSAYLDRRRKVVGASVVVRPENDSSRIWLTTTDAKGRFRVNGIPDGSYRVEIRRDGLAPVTKNNVSLKYPFRAVVEVEMQPLTGAAPAAPPGPANGSLEDTASVRGAITGVDGQPVSEVNVRVVRSDAATDPRDARTDSGGDFTFPGLKTGNYLVSVLGLGYLPIRAMLPFEGDSDLTVVVIPQPADYEPAALDLLPPERPIPPADLVWQPRDEPPAAAGEPASETAGEASGEEHLTGETGDDAIAGQDASEPQDTESNQDADQAAEQDDGSS